MSDSVWPHRRQPPGSPVPGILQARTLEWVAISFSNVWKWKVKTKSLSHVRLLATPWTAAYQAPPSMGFSRQKYRSGVPLPSPNGPHTRSQNKSQHIKEDRNYFKHLFWSQWHDTRNQPQKEKWEKNECMKTKQHFTKKTMGQKLKQRRKHKIPWYKKKKKKMKLQPYKNLWDTAKAVLRGEFIVIQVYLKK